MQTKIRPEHSKMSKKQNKSFIIRENNMLEFSRKSYVYNKLKINMRTTIIM